MTLRSKRILESCFAGLLVLAGCKDPDECVRARNAASDTWRTVAVTASTNKLAPAIGVDEIPPDKKANHVETWSTLEKQAEMIASSFAYEKITWNTADPALEKANRAFDGYFAKGEFRSFEMQLKDANDKFKAATAACR